MVEALATTTFKCRTRCGEPASTSPGSLRALDYRVVHAGQRLERVRHREQYDGLLFPYSEWRSDGHGAPVPRANARDSVETFFAVVMIDAYPPLSSR
jgi:hypothetical protein